LDNVTVWEILFASLKDTTFITYIKPFAKKQDGREAFKALHTQLLGSEAINNHASTAENKLQELALDGNRRKGWGFDKFVLAHKEQHIILEKLKVYGYSGLDENSKCRHFLNGITDPSLAPVRGALACNHQSKSFDDIVTSFRTYKESVDTKRRKQPTSVKFNVSQISSSTGNRGAGKEVKRGETPDGYNQGTNYDQHKIASRFYKAKEWNALTKGQRNYLRSKSPGRKATGKRSRDDSAELRRTVKMLTASIQEIRAETTGKAMRKMNIASDTETESESDSSTPKKRTKIPRKKRA